MRVSIGLFASFIVLVDAPLPTIAEQHAQATDAEVLASRPKTCGESIDRRSISTEEFNKKCIAIAGPLAAMRGEKLVLRLDNGDRRIFDNKDSIGAVEAGFGYGLADFYPSTHIFVVGDFGADSTHFAAIDGKTGRKQAFGYAFPQFSPDGNSVLTVAYNADEETESDFAILDLRGKQPLTVWTSKKSKPPMPPKAEFVVWDDNKTIKFKSPGQKPVVLIRADNGAWNINPTPGASR